MLDQYRILHASALLVPSLSLYISSPFFHSNRGMYPSAAGKIASNGPYQSVKDIYKIPGLTENDKKMFKKYEKDLTANKAQYRTFNERINSRVST